MASNYGVIGFLKPPTLIAVTKAELVKFKEEYDVYIEKCADVNKSRADEGKILVASIRHCMDGQLLSALVKMNKIGDATSVEEATPTRVKEWFDATINFAPQDLSERIAAVIPSVKYNKVRGDPAGSALNFCVDIMKALSKNVAEDVQHDADQAAKFIDKLVEKVEATCKVLRERLKVRREGWSKKERGDFNKFEGELASLAIDVHQNEIAMKRTGKESSSTKVEKDHKLAMNKNGKNKEEGNSPNNKNGHVKNAKKRNRESGVWNKVCLGPRCKKLNA